MNRWIPATLGDLTDYIVWMFSGLPDFSSPHGIPTDPDEVFADARQGLANIEGKIGRAGVIRLSEMLGQAKELLDAGDDMAASHRLRDMTDYIRAKEYRGS